MFFKILCWSTLAFFSGWLGVKGFRPKLVIIVLRFELLRGIFVVNSSAGRIGIVGIRFSAKDFLLVLLTGRVVLSGPSFRRRDA